MSWRHPREQPCGLVPMCPDFCPDAEDVARPTFFWDMYAPFVRDLGQALADDEAERRVQALRATVRR